MTKRKPGAIALLLVTLSLVPMISGCGEYLLVASQVATAAAQILQSTEPEAAEYLTEASNSLLQLNALVGEIKAAKDATAKQAIAVRAQSIVAAATSHLSQTLAALHVKDPATIQKVQIAVGIVNASLSILIAQLTKAGAPVIHSAVGSRLPKSAGKSAAEFRAEWNKAAPEQKI